MKQFLSWLIKNRKAVITGIGLAYEYLPKAYRWCKYKIDNRRKKRLEKTNK